MRSAFHAEDVADDMKSRRHMPLVRFAFDDVDAAAEIDDELTRSGIVRGDHLRTYTCSKR